MIRHKGKPQVVELPRSTSSGRRPIANEDKPKPVNLQPVTALPRSSSAGRRPIANESKPKPVLLQQMRPARTRELDSRSVQGEVVAVVVTKRPWLAEHVGRMLAWQSLRPVAVVVCSAHPDYDPSPIRVELPDVPVTFVPAYAMASIGTLRNLAMEAANSLAPNAIMCTVDDDDCYGIHYFAGIVDAWQRHPIALVVGLGSFETVTVQSPPRVPLKQDHRFRAGLRAPIGGATISIPAKVWRERPDLRYPTNVGCGEDMELLKIAHAENRVAAAYFGDFVALRYADPAHGHTSPNQGLPGR